MAKKARKTNRRKKVSQAEPDSLALPDVDGDKSTGVPDPVVVKKDPAHRQYTKPLHTFRL